MLRVLLSGRPGAGRPRIAVRGLPRIAVRGLPLALAAGLALTAGACMAPSAKKSAAAGERAATAGSGQPSGAQGEKSGDSELSWWQKLRRHHREPKEKPWVYGDVRRGGGLLSNDEDGFTLYRQGETGSSDPGKPAKVRR